jgi:hypothetical protein
MHCIAPDQCSGQVQANVPFAFTSIWLDATSVWLASTSGMVRCTDLSHCDLLTPSFQGTINAIWGSGPNDVWGVGSTTTLTGSQSIDAIWSCRADTRTCDHFLVGQLFAGSVVDELLSVWGTGSSDVWVAGTYGLLAHCTAPATTSCTTLVGQAADSAPFYTVNGTGPNDVWSAGGRGLINHCTDPTHCRPATLGCATSSTLHASFVDSGGNVWFAGEGGALFFIRRGT